MNSIFLFDSDNNLIAKKACLSTKDKIDNNYCSFITSFVNDTIHYISFGEEDILETMLKTNSIYRYKFLYNDSMNGYKIERTFIQIDRQIKPEDSTFGTDYRWVGFISKTKCINEIQVEYNKCKLIENLGFEEIEQLTSPLKIRNRKLDKV